MKMKYIIKCIVVGLDTGSLHEYVKAFVVTDGVKTFEVDISCCDYFEDVFDNMSADEVIEWAKSMVGKTLFCEKLQPIAFEPVGKSYIV